MKATATFPEVALLPLGPEDDAMTLPLANLHVLVVEDEYFIADDIAEALRRQGAEVIGPASDREEALRFMRSSPRIDGAVLDINLRGEAVYPIAELLRARGVPVVFATGYAAAVIPEGFENVPRWEKPFDADRLARTLRGLLGRSGGAAA